MPANPRACLHAWLTHRFCTSTTFLASASPRESHEQSRRNAASRTRIPARRARATPLEARALIGTIEGRPGHHTGVRRSAFRVGGYPVTGRRRQVDGMTVVLLAPVRRVDPIRPRA